MAEKEKLMVILSMCLETAPHLIAGVSSPLMSHPSPFLFSRPRLAGWLARLFGGLLTSLAPPLHWLVSFLSPPAHSQMYVLSQRV